MSRPSATILEHLHSPRNAGMLVNPQVVGRADFDGRAPRIAIYLHINGQVITRATFETFGCGYSIACCSALTELLIGRGIDACREISVADVDSAVCGLPADKQFCAEVAMAALNNALAQWDGIQGGDDG